MAAPRHEHATGPALCEYFVTCQRAASGTTEHDVAGVVPICASCAELAGVQRTAYVSEQSPRCRDEAPSSAYSEDPRVS